MAAPEPSLTPTQTNALFHILTHHETYDEIEALKRPDAISQYGYPFVSSKSSKGAGGGGKDDKDAKPRYAGTSESPVLSTLVRRFLLTLPGLRDVPPEFWSSRLQGLLRKFAEADLSESYDKGVMGTRKTLATAMSALVESLVRGLFGGYPPREGGRADKYDLKSAADLQKAVGHAIHEVVYGNLINEVTDWLAETDDLEGHSPMMEAAVEYEIIHIATLFHQVFILSSEGQYLLKLIENVHGMLPYAMIRQTLRMSNAATMMSGMVKLFLSKLSVGSFTNYIGFTKNAEDGMNLLQRIISMVLGWDSAEFKKTTDRIEKDENAPKQECLSAIKSHVAGPAEKREAAREKSKREMKSVVAVILADAGPQLLGELSIEQHAACQEYYSALLSIRDRDEITAVLCKQSPDLFTQVVRDFVGGYEPFIRAVHEKVDLREHVEDYQSFVDQFIATSKPKKVGEGETEADASGLRAPTVEDYAALLRKNKHMLYKWMHHGAKQAPQVRDTFRDWADEAMVHFRKPGVSVRGSSSHVEGTMIEQVAPLFDELPADKKASLLPVIDEHAAYLEQMAGLSTKRMQQIIDGKSETVAGPGIFLMQWQALLDETLITPDMPMGQVRRGRDVRDATAEGKTGATATTTSSKEGWDGGEAARKEAVEALPEPPEVRAVVDALGLEFKKLVATTEADGSGSDISID